MGSGDGFTLVPEWRVRDGRCASCDAATRMDAPPLTGALADYGDAVFVLDGPHGDGFIVVPRRHVERIEELPVNSRARVLAAVRCVVNAVGEKTPWSAPRIVTVTGTPASEGHLSIHVQP